MTQNKTTGILTFSKYNRRDLTGSSRIRGTWLTKYWEEAEIFIQGKQYDSVIYQKAYWIEHAHAFKGVKILDLCDPDYLWWQGRIVEMGQECDGFTTSTEALAEDLRKFFPNKPVKCVKDRMDLEFYKEKKVHEGQAKNVVWFGYHTNFEMILPVLTFLEKLGLGLIVISDKGFIMPSQYIDKIPYVNYPWKEESVNNDIIKGDIVINPQSIKGKWKYKSENKTISSYLLNMPVAENVTDLQRLIDPETRITESNKNLEYAIKNYDVRISVQEYKDFIEEIRSKKIN